MGDDRTKAEKKKNIYIYRLRSKGSMLGDTIESPKVRKKSTWV